MPSKYVKKGGHGGKRTGTGRPEYKPTRAQRAMVTAMVINGLEVQEITEVISAERTMKGESPLAVATVEKHFRVELRTAVAKSNSMVASAVLKAIRKGNANVGMRWLERRGGEVWKPVNQFELANKAGEVFNISAVDWSQIHEDDLKQVRAGKITTDLIERLKASVATTAMAVVKQEVSKEGES